MLRRYFIAGLLIWVPLWITLLVISFLAGLMDKTFSLLPHDYQPDHLLGFHIPGLGLVFTLALVLLTGILATNFFGDKLVRIAEALMEKFLSCVRFIRVPNKLCKPSLNQMVNLLRKFY